MRTLFTAEGHQSKVDAAAVERLVAAPHDIFWLDMESPDDDDYRLLTDTFKFHQLTIEDVKHQNQRPKLDGYDGYVFAVVFVVGFAKNHVSFREHHLYIAPSFLVTVHLQPEPSFEKLNQRIAESPANVCRKVDRLQDEILIDATISQLALLQDLKHDAVEMRRVLGAQRDMFQRMVTLSLDEDRETTAYYRDVYDHIIRQYENVDSLRDLLTGAMDVYLSTVSNRLNVTMKALTVVASLFLPLTFLTGFFGMNFGWLVARIGSPFAFGVVVAVMAISILTQLVFFKRRGWL
jgi:magnesium transporter